MSWFQDCLEVDVTSTEDYVVYEDVCNGGYYYEVEQDGKKYWKSETSGKFYNDSGFEIVTPSTKKIKEEKTFLGKLLGGVEQYVTNQDVINQALGQLTGFTVRDNEPQQLVNSGSGRKDDFEQPTPTQNNTALYIIGGVLVVGMIATMIIVIKKK